MTNSARISDNDRTASASLLIIHTKINENSVVVLIKLVTPDRIINVLNQHETDS